MFDAIAQLAKFNPNAPKKSEPGPCHELSVFGLALHALQKVTFL
jgi:hypothetical protein